MLLADKPKSGFSTEEVLPKAELVGDRGSRGGGGGGVGELTGRMLPQKLLNLHMP